MDGTTLLLLAGGAALAYYLYTSGSLAQAAPLSIYPEFAYTATPTKSSQSSTKQIVSPTSLYTSAQGQNVSAMYAQCAGAYPGCTPMMTDTQLGF